MQKYVTSCCISVDQFVKPASHQFRNFEVGYKNWIIRNLFSTTTVRGSYKNIVFLRTIFSCTFMSWVKQGLGRWRIFFSSYKYHLFKISSFYFHFHSPCGVTESMTIKYTVPDQQTMGHSSFYHSIGLYIKNTKFKTSILDYLTYMPSQCFRVKSVIIPRASFEGQSHQSINYIFLNQFSMCGQGLI